MLRQMGISCVALAVALGCVLEAQNAMAQFTGAANQFGATKDVHIRGHELEQLSNSGDAGRVRASKRDQDVTIIDFDTVAMGDFLTANPGMTASWTLNVQPAEGGGINANIGILSVESLVDWTEGNGDGSGSALNWTPGTSAATYFYAQTLTNGDGTLNTAGSVEWIDPDSGAYTFTPRTPDYTTWGVPDTVGGGTSTTANNPTPEFVNSAEITPTSWAIAFGAGEYVSVALDNDIANAMINDTNNRGVRFGPLVSTQTLNTRMWDRNQSGGLFTPYLEVTLSPSVGLPGDFNNDDVVDAADYTVWLDNLGSSFDLNGNGDESGGSAGLVDTADYDLWKSSFGDTPGIGTGGSGAIPEPSSILLLCSGLFAWASCRRRLSA